jgi:hypothetical protein
MGARRMPPRPALSPPPDRATSGSRRLTIPSRSSCLPRLAASRRAARRNLARHQTMSRHEQRRYLPSAFGTNLSDRRTPGDLAAADPDEIRALACAAASASRGSPANIPSSSSKVLIASRTSASSSSTRTHHPAMTLPRTRLRRDQRRPARQQRIDRRAAPDADWPRSAPAAAPGVHDRQPQAEAAAPIALCLHELPNTVSCLSSSAVRCRPTHCARARGADSVTAPSRVLDGVVEQVAQQRFNAGSCEHRSGSLLTQLQVAIGDGALNSF